LNSEFEFEFRIISFIESFRVPRQEIPIKHPRLQGVLLRILQFKRMLRVGGELVEGYA
jgi:hypothetical protein